MTGWGEGGRKEGYDSRWKDKRGLTEVALHASISELQLQWPAGGKEGRQRHPLERGRSEAMLDCITWWLVSCSFSDRPGQRQPLERGARQCAALPVTGQELQPAGISKSFEDLNIRRSSKTMASIQISLSAKQIVIYNINVWKGGVNKGLTDDGTNCFQRETNVQCLSFLHNKKVELES